MIFAIDLSIRSYLQFNGKCPNVLAGPFFNQLYFDQVLDKTCKNPSKTRAKQISCKLAPFGLVYFSKFFKYNSIVIHKQKQPKKYLVHTLYQQPFTNIYTKTHNTKLSNIFTLSPPPPPTHPHPPVKQPPPPPTPHHTHHYTISSPPQSVCRRH